MPLRDLLPLHDATLAVDVACAVVTAAFVLRGLNTLVRGGSVTRARFQVADGAILGLSLKAAATLLRTLELRDWNGILRFAAVLGLTVLLKTVFTWEQGRTRGPAASAQQQQQ